eukprot:TRINITY_DN1146_c0_g1_i1.p1 TRINITY_DN1146_c0_g1~~TRINITY_DN1146_c0_g1_i1.p1  ORF type:complete len:782 (+),score=242.08 TRINITY_DN1146_c0_g1_i1:347-2692(+)
MEELQEAIGSESDGSEEGPNYQFIDRGAESVSDSELEREEAKIEAQRRDGYLFYGNLNREYDSLDSADEARRMESIQRSDDEYRVMDRSDYSSDDGFVVADDESISGDQPYDSSVSSSSSDEEEKSIHGHSDDDSQQSELLSTFRKVMGPRRRRRLKKQGQRVGSSTTDVVDLVDDEDSTSLLNSLSLPSVSQQPLDSDSDDVIIHDSDSGNEAEQQTKRPKKEKEKKKEKSKVKYTETEEEEEEGGSGLKKYTETTKFGTYQVIRADYRFPEHFFGDEVPRIELEREAIIYINFILDQAGMEQIELPELPTRAAFLDEKPELLRDTMRRLAKQGLYRADRMRKTRPQKDVESELMQEVKRQLDPHYSLLHFKFERYYEPDPSSQVLTSEDSLWADEEREVIYAPSLTIPERTEGLAHFEYNQKLLDSHLWLDIPIVMTPPGTYYSTEKMPGFVTMPVDFDVVEMKAYLDETLPTIRMDRRRIRNRIHTVRYLQGQLRDNLELADVQVELWYEQAVEPLYQLMINYDKLSDCFVEGYIFIISSRFEEMEVDVRNMTLRLPPDFSGAAVVSLLTLHRKEMAKKHFLSVKTGRHNERIVKALVLLRDILKVKRVLIGHQLAPHHLGQFLAILNLKLHAETISQLPFEDVTIVVTVTRWKIDRKRKRLYLPCQFDRDQLFDFFSRSAKGRGGGAPPPPPPTEGVSGGGREGEEEGEEDGGLGRSEEEGVEVEAKTTVKGEGKEREGEGEREEGVGKGEGGEGEGGEEGKAGMAAAAATSHRLEL